VQNFHHRTWRALAHLAYVRKHDIWLYSLPKRLVCTGKSPALPSELWDELRAALPRGWRDSDGEGLRLRCQSLDRVVRLPAAGWRRSSRNSLMDVLEHQHASDATADWEVEVVTPLDALAPATECPALDEYREGKLTDAELWTQLGDWQREYAADGGALGVIHGSEMLAPDDFTARLSLSGHDARIARELLERYDGAVAVEALTLGAVAGATWKPHGQQLLVDWGGSADEREPLEQLRDALARAEMHDALAALPELGSLPPLPALADRAVRLLRTGRGEDLQRELAAAIGVALGTVSNRLRRLHETGVLRGFLPDIDAEQAGFTLTTIMQMRIAKGQIIAVQASVAEHPRVFGVYDVTGEWDSLVLARFRDRAEMDAFIKSTLSQPHIERTNTSLVLNTVKQEPRIVI